MSYEEMFPTNKNTPRAMCPECYAAWIREVTEQCPVCGDYLENWRVNNQRHQPHEVSFRLHDGRCLDYFSLLSGKALGQRVGIIDEACAYGYPQLQQGYVDGQHKKNVHRQAGTNDFVPQRPVKTLYKGKEVKVIRK
jgi:hypothetical protein